MTAKFRDLAPRSANGWDEDEARRDIANRLFFRLYQASNLMHKTGTKAVDNFGSTTQQWAVLGALARPHVRESGISVKELMDYLMLSRQSLTAVLDRLERGGLIARVKGGKDGRIRLVRMTSEGAKVWERMLRPIHAYYRQALAGFSTEEAYLLMRLLDRMRDALARF